MIAELDRILSHGLTAVQARVIVGIYNLAHESQLAPRMTDIADWCKVSTAAATGLIDRMETAGLVTRFHSPHDRRSIGTALTIKGINIAEKLLPPTPENPLLSIGKLLQADLQKNNHFTKDPMFCLQKLHRETGYDITYADNQCWWNAELSEVIYDDDTTERKEDLEFKEDNDAWEGPYGYKDQWQTVMISLTQKGINDYMERDGHNVRRSAFRGQTRTYVESFHRCEEMINVRNSLISLATSTP